VHLAGLDLNLLVTLDALLEERNVTRAARRMGLSQSAMSHALARLRDLLADPVLVRSGRGMLPTPRAEAVGRPLREALGAIERTLRAPPAFDPGTAEKAFRMWGGDFAEMVVLPPLLARLSTAAPGLDLAFAPSIEGIRPSLTRGEIDLAFAPVRTVDRGPGIQEEALFEERFVSVVRTGHPLAAGKLTPARFAEARHAFIAPRGRPGGAVDDALARLGLRRRVVLMLPHFVVAPHVVAASDLVLTLPERMARLLVAQLPITVLETPLVLPTFTVSMIWHERSDADPAHAWLRAEVRALGEQVAKSAPRRSRGRGARRA
jgi:DNA-binding transcriptional LysR family regulator